MILESTTGKILEVNETTRNGVKVGKVSGLITTFEPNRPFDSRNLPKRFERTAFQATLETHRDRGNRPVKLKLEHVELIGGFPLDGIHVNSDGLFGTGEINLETQVGQETFALAKQGVLTDFSIGYDVTSEHTEGGDRIADSIELFEASIVSEPANQDAKITSLESLSVRELEHLLIATGRFSRSAARELASRISAVQEDDEEQEARQELISNMKEFMDSL